MFGEEAKISQSSDNYVYWTDRYKIWDMSGFWKKKNCSSGP